MPQKESAEDKNLTEVEWRDKTGKRLAARRAAEKDRDEETMATVKDLTVLVDDALEDGVVPEDLFALNLIEEGQKLSRKESQHSD